MQLMSGDEFRRLIKIATRRMIEDEQEAYRLARSSECSIKESQDHDRLRTQSSGNSDDIESAGPHCNEWCSIYGRSREKVFDHVTASKVANSQPIADAPWASGVLDPFAGVKNVTPGEVRRRLARQIDL